MELKGSSALEFSLKTEQLLLHSPKAPCIKAMVELFIEELRQVREHCSAVGNEGGFPHGPERVHRTTWSESFRSWGQDLTFPLLFPQDTNYVVALRSYIADDKSLLSFKKGDLIELLPMQGVEPGEGVCQDWEERWGMDSRACWTHGAPKFYMLLLSKPEESRLLKGWQSQPSALPFFNNNPPSSSCHSYRGCYLRMQESLVSLMLSFPSRMLHCSFLLVAAMVPDSTLFLQAGSLAPLVAAAVFSPPAWCNWLQPLITSVPAWTDVEGCGRA